MHFKFPFIRYKHYIGSELKLTVKKVVYINVILHTKLKKNYKNPPHFRVEEGDKEKKEKVKERK